MTTWNLDHIYPFEKTEELITELQKQVLEFQEFRSELEDLTPERFMHILKKKEALVESCVKLQQHASLLLTENTSDVRRNAHEARISELCTDAANATMYFTLWFKNLQNVDPYLEVAGPYKYFLERIRAFRDHTLKEAEEQIINLKDLSGAEALTRMYDLVTNKFTFLWEGKEITQEELNPLKMSAKREEREGSYNLLFEKYAGEEEVLGEIYRSLANDWKNENLKLRKYQTPIAVRNLANDVPKEAIQALLTVVKRNVQLFSDYFAMKYKMLGLKDRYDLYAPYKKEEKDYSYEESKKITLETYKEFSEQTHDLALQIFEEKHVHADIQPGKRSGAFCCSVLKENTPYIMLNHTNKLRDLFTMMHEFGHGIHSLASKNQTQFTFHATLPLAETASIFGEMLLSKKLLKEADPEEKKGLLFNLLDGQYGSIIRQSYFVLFEEAAHDAIAKGATVHDLNDLYMKNLQEQFGMEIPDVFKHEWKYIPHIYHSPFYCYAYAFGNLLVLALFNMYETEGKDFIPKFMKILSYGGSKSPTDILQEIGIDITQESFWEQGFAVIRKEIEELKALMA